MLTREGVEGWRLLNQQREGRGREGGGEVGGGQGARWEGRATATT